MIFLMNQFTNSLLPYIGRYWQIQNSFYSSPSKVCRPGTALHHQQAGGGGGDHTHQQVDGGGGDHT